MSDFPDYLLPELARFLHNRLLSPLPGKTAQYKMAGMRRIEQLFPDADISKARLSGVLILLYPADGYISTVLIRRPLYEGVHSGQLAFPGGRKEELDTDLVATALRESQEETGINPEEVILIGQLSELFIPPSNSLVSPVVGYCTNKQVFIPDSFEVDAIIEIPLHQFLLPEVNTMRFVNAGNWNAEVPCFYIQEQTIWGATAMILSEFLEILTEFKPIQSQ
jgi:8-oxo-dGTP pyrophosphatase MutT (NUDIX family)